MPKTVEQAGVDAAIIAVQATFLISGGRRDAEGGIRAPENGRLVVNSARLAVNVLGAGLAAMAAGCADPVMKSIFESYAERVAATKLEGERD